jgi:hypothetical protein
MKSTEPALRIGQAAAQLGVTPHHLRQLCKCGLIEAEQSVGHQWRIPLNEIERLASEGVPAAPTLMQEPSEVPARTTPPSGLYRDASDELADAAESVEIITKRVQRRRIELEGAQVEDEFEERARRKAAEEAENRRLLAEAKAQQEQQEWLQGKLAYALARLPQAAPLELKQAAYNAALKFLQNTDRRIVPDEMVNAFLNDSVQTVVQAYNQRQNEIKRQEQEARQRTLLENVNTLVGIAAASQAQEARQFEAFFAIAHPPRPAPAPQQIVAPLSSLEAERQARRRAAADKADARLGHINTDLAKYDFSNSLERRKEADRLRPLIRQALIDALVQTPDMDNRQIRAFIEREIEERIS